MSERVEPCRDGCWLDWGGTGPPLHFAHGNGFPPATYSRLLESFRPHHRVVTMEARPLWPGSHPGWLSDWSQLAGDLAEEVERRGARGAIGVGHSMGAVVSLLAAARDPGLFSAVVAIDPVLLAGWITPMWGAMKAIGLAGQMPLVRGARTRTNRFPDRAASLDPYRTRRMFRSWQPDVFDDYWKAALVPDGDGGWTLRYPRRWEARIFRVSPHNVWPRLRRLRVPSLFIQGERSDSFFAAAVRKVGRQVPGARVEVFRGAGHCVAMERPEEVGATVLRFLAGVGT